MRLSMRCVIAVLRLLAASVLALERQEQHPPDVERRQEHARQRDAEHPRPVLPRVRQDLVLAPEAGERKDADERQLPMRNVANVIGMYRARPPIFRMSNVPVAWFTEPEPRNSSALKNACVNRWKIAATYPPTPSAIIM